jgi:nicotinate-nucleotide pyrophosphorylase (carboxylating)
MFRPSHIHTKKILEFLEEDIGQGDITTQLVIPPNIIIEAEIIAKDNGVIAGIKDIIALCEILNLQSTTSIHDGSEVNPKMLVLHIKGDARTILSIERTLLNLLTRMSGIATTTQKILTKLRSAGYNTIIASTRKTAPGLSYFDKRAVHIGGGDTHRFHLDDLILIKDNHLEIVGDIAKALKQARDVASFTKKIEIEVTSPDGALEAAKAGADIILLDNFHISKVKETVALLTKAGLREDILLESSGRITIDNILDYAAAGVDIVSLGEITHSTNILDMSLEVTKVS